MGINKKRYYLFSLLFLTSIFPKFVSSKDVTYQAQNLGQTIFTSIFGFFGAFINPSIINTEMMSRVFFAILLGIVIFSIINIMFKGSKQWIKWVITISVTAISLLGLPAGYIAMLLTNYGAMGATILTIIPFLIILTFSIQTENRLFAKLIWIIYSLYYFSMYVSDAFSNSNGFWTVTNIPYFTGFIIGIFMFGFIVKIRKKMFEEKIDSVKEKAEQNISKRKIVDDAKLTEFENLSS